MRAFLFSLLAVISLPSAAKELYHLEHIMLLQPEFIFSERSPGAQEVSDYITSLGSAAGKALAKEQKHYKAAGFIAIAVRPGGLSKVWFDLKPALPADVEERLKQALESSPPFSAKKGVVVFALNITLGSASPTGPGFPAPVAWQDAMTDESEPLEIGALVDKIWPAPAP
jgi:hypothetical protein